MGRGPVLQAMPAIKTLNLTVQLILENAEMAIAGSYVYDDDGVFNLITLRYSPALLYLEALALLESL